MTTTTADNLRRAITSGGDERCLIDARTGTNRYHLDPVRFDDLFSRGSCTANTLNDATLLVAHRFLDRRPELRFDDLLRNHADRLKALAGRSCSVDFEVFWGSSGTDLLYLPLLFQLAVAPERRVVNVVSCPEELGSGSLLAADGRFFAARTQFGEPVPTGERLAPLVPLEVHTLPARDHGGRIIKRREPLERILAENADASLIGNLVYGSKSGIEDDLGVIDDRPEGVMWVVDLCQFRVDQPLVARLLEAGALVMVTGSKFFEAPPFCAALLVPDPWLQHLGDAGGDQLAPFGSVVSAHDVPARLEGIRHQLPARENWGLRLRWEVALAEMEAFGELPRHETEHAIARWNDAICGHVGKNASFRLIPDQHLTNRSIISFQILTGGNLLDRDQLAAVFATLATTHHDGFTGGARRVFIGQPVVYGRDAFVRVAIGSSTVRALARGGALLDDDHRMIDVIASTAQRLFG